MKLKPQTGAVALEFAIILPVFLLLLCGVIEFGIALYDKAVITNASREGARVGVVYRVDPVSGIYNPLSPAEIEAVVNNYLSKIPLIPGPSAVTVTVPPPTGNQLSVTVAWNYTLLLFPQLISTPINLAATTVMNLE